MNLQNFEQQIDGRIVGRGHAYYLDDLSAFIDVDGFDYRFQVFGSEVYKVTVRLGEDDDIVSSDCDCPFTYGPICKHEVAVYFELRDLKEDESGKWIVEAEIPTDLKTVLNDLSKDELVRIVAEFASENLILKNHLLIQYSKKTTGLKHFKSLVRAIVSEYTGRAGYIDYKETYYFVRELEGCLLQIKANEDAVNTLQLAFILLEEAIGAFQYADDSNGDVGDLVQDTLEVINAIVSDAIESEYGQRQALFEILLRQCGNPILNGWEEFREALLSTCTHFADNKENRQTLIEKIESLIDEKSPDSSQYYHNEALNRLLFEMIEEWGTKEEENRFIQAHLQYSSFREQLIQRYMAEEKYNQVIQLAEDGEVGDEEYRGLISRWKKYRYAAYQALSLSEEQKVLAKELFMAGDFDYYQELKGLVENSQQFYIQLKQELKPKSDWQARSLFRSLIEEENDLVEMMAFVQRNPELIEQYADKLVGHYQDDIQAIYRRHILSRAHYASERGAYQDVCRMIGRYTKIVGEQHKQSIVDELRNSYKRKPAFMDELSRV